MKHIEVSKKITLSRKIKPELFKESLLERLSKVIDVETVGDGIDDFSVRGTTGAPASFMRHCSLQLDCNIEHEEDTVRVLISGHAKTALSLSIVYFVLFLVMLLVGLLPGSIETNAETSGALDALIFLVFGIYIVTDINRKLSEPKEHIESALESLNTQFG